MEVAEYQDSEGRLTAPVSADVAKIDLIESPIREHEREIRFPYL